ncbi:hypothetical protein AX16_001158 [Volvariella volvacea WC 439]|nr:hypothetical protein AX16_001158 [Volvariella volvacea WC 439]
MSGSTQNLEEAASIASEFIYSIDNLPAEVAHLLQEIKFKEARSQELYQEIEKDSAKYIRHSLRAAASSNNSSVTSTPTPTPTTPSSINNNNTPPPQTPTPTAVRAPSPKSSHLPAKIAAAYAEIDQLADEKILLAQKVINLIQRTRARLDVDLSKVRVLQGENTMDYTFTGASASPIVASGTGSQGYGYGGASVGYGYGYGVGDGAGAGSISAGGGGLGGRNPAGQISESLRNALSNIPVGGAGSGSGTTTPGGNANKKRKIGTSGSIKLTPAPSPTKHRSASPVAAPAPHSGHQRSRLSRQVQMVVDDLDRDAEGEEEEGEGEEGDGDDTLYCFCQRHSFGDMIACDNEGDCPYEWFHLACVGLKQPTPEKWYCDDCTARGVGQTTTATTTRKGRKKQS